MEESIPRIKKCLAQLDQEEVWHQPNQNTPSIGNLILHLEGNCRQWILSGLLNWPDDRERDLEFNPKSHPSKHQLINRLDQLASDLEENLDQVNINDLLESKPVQVFEEPGISILIHAIEHFSYHTGQITLHTKLIKDIDTGYYNHLSL